MLAHVVIQQTVLDLINRLRRLRCDLFQTHPHQHRAPNMISLHTGFATLTTFGPRDLLAFALKLLDLPGKPHTFCVAAVSSCAMSLVAT